LRNRFGWWKDGLDDSARANVSAEPWEAFFDRHYLLTYTPLQTDDRSRAKVLAAARLAGLPPGSRVLDVPCGGRKVT